jgi:hypothetical protein
LKGFVPDFEMGILAHSAVAGMGERTLIDGVTCGNGLVKERQVAVIAKAVSFLDGRELKFKRDDFRIIHQFFRNL